jgi:hypothetical protein
MLSSGTVRASGLRTETPMKRRIVELTRVGARALSSAAGASYLMPTTTTMSRIRTAAMPVPATVIRMASITVRFPCRGCGAGRWRRKGRRPSAGAGRTSGGELAGMGGYCAALPAGGAVVAGLAEPSGDGAGWAGVAAVLGECGEEAGPSLRTRSRRSARLLV